MTLARLEPVINLRGKDGVAISDDRIRLLEAIDAHGSISAAARSVGLTYKAARDAVAAINNLAERPLVIGRVGRRRVAAVRCSRRTAGVFFARYSLCSRLATRPEFGKDIVLPTLSWRYLMKTSARTMLLSKVAEVRPGTVNAEVILDVGDEIRLVAIITEESVKTLGLKPGLEVFALIKSSFVLLAPEGEIGRTSARNVISGKVIRREDGAVNSEIVLDIGGGKTLAAIITKESAHSLAFKVGDRACALIKASHIILAVD